MRAQRLLNNRLLILILAFSVIARVITSFWMGDEIQYLPAIFDQFSYHTLATRILGGYGFTFDQLWWPLTRAGEPTAHWSYLYTLFLTSIYWLFGVHPLLARLFQAILAGILMPWFAYRLASRVFKASPSELPKITQDTGTQNSKTHIIIQLLGNPSQSVPLIAAAWVAFYGYFIYFAAALMTETFFMVAILWTLDCAIRISDANHQKALPYLQWIELGIAVSIAVLLRQVFLIFVPILFLWLVWAISRGYHRTRTQSKWSDLKEAIKKTGPGLLFVIVILILFVGPFTLYNYQRFGRFVLLNTNAGYAFYLSNHPSYSTRYQAMLTSQEFRAMIPASISNLGEADLDQELLKRGLEFVLHDPVRYLLLSASRIPVFFLFWPTKLSSTMSDINRVLSFGLALPFMLLGIGLWIADIRKKIWPLEPGALLLVFGAIYSAIHLLSWASIRYRLPVDAVFLTFAAYGLVCTIRVFLQAITKNHQPL